MPYLRRFGVIAYSRCVKYLSLCYTTLSSMHHAHPFFAYQVAVRTLLVAVFHNQENYH